MALDTPSLRSDALTLAAYQSSDKQEWDRFVHESKNGTFLFLRDYMDYHRDRFADASLIARDEQGRIVALLPCNRAADLIEAHGGLTYGGFVTDRRMSAALMLRTCEEFVRHCREYGVSQVIYKPVPHIYHRLPAEEDLYALFRLGAVLWRRDVSTAVRCDEPIAMQERRQRGAKKAHAQGIACRRSEDYEAFWSVLEDNLWTQHRRKPVHSLEEMRLLQARFPDAITLHAAYDRGALVAGVVVYESAMVAHAQYIASSGQARACGALDALFMHLITEAYRHKAYFDFGISTESEGQALNEGLAAFKEGFGGRTVLYDSYRLPIVGR